MDCRNSLIVSAHLQRSLGWNLVRELEHHLVMPLPALRNHCRLIGRIEQLSDVISRYDSDPDQPRASSNRRNAIRQRHLGIAA